VEVTVTFVLLAALQAWVEQGINLREGMCV
jgi:hypothetical protein